MPSASIGSGSDALVLRVSEDAYQGDAQFTVSVDGQQVGDVLTATALHGSGTEDLIFVGGTFGFVSHTVTVNFLNDAYDGTPATDRNLYVDSIDTSGAGTLPDGQAVLYSAGPRSFSFRFPAPNTKIWVGGNSDNSFDDPLNWTPSGTPQSTDQLFIPAGTININGGDANGAMLRPQPYTAPGQYPSSVSSTATINLNSASVKMFDGGGDTTRVFQPPYPSGPSINAFGSSSLSASFSGDRIFGFVYATINVEADSTLFLGSMNLNYSRVSINGAAGAQLENDGKVNLQSNATLTINADTVGVGSFAPQYATTLEFGGAVGSGQTIAIDATVPASLLVDHPDTFQALIDWQATYRDSNPTVDLKGVMADSFDYSNDLLTLYSGGQVADTTRLAIKPATDGDFPNAGVPKETLHVVQGADGVLLSLTTASAAPGLPVHI